ncbi:hypothetical protein L7F22_047936 [Adiantum nelumboides]|nr:hypothetical protein [Adiantum nelumboides]
MDNLISGLLNTALDAASSALHLDKSPPSSPTVGDSTSIDRSTWAEIAAGTDSHKSNHEERPHARHNAEQQQHGGSWQSADHEFNSSFQRHKQSYLSAVADYPQQEESHDNYDNDWQSAGHRRNRPHFNNQHMVPDKQWHEFKKPPNEQQYAKPVDEDVDIEPRQEELHSLAAACRRLWELDLNRLTPGLDYEINCGDGKKVYNKEDMAENSLFRKVNRDVFRRPTYARFYALLDNYTAKQGEREHVTAEERQEELAFLEEISRSAPIKYLHEYLAAKRVVSRSREEFKQQLHSLWFGLYGRGGSQGSSSAFEHVFVGELKSGYGEEVSGFHNWIKFYVEEAAGRIDYQGYILPRRRNCAEPDAHTQCLSIQFTWNGVLKPVSSTFVGVSPEFELALYTLCFYLGEEDNYLELGPYSVNIKCYHLGREKMGSCFPIAED